MHFKQLNIDYWLSGQFKFSKLLFQCVECGVVEWIARPPARIVVESLLLELGFVERRVRGELVGRLREQSGVQRRDVCVQII